MPLDGNNSRSGAKFLSPTDFLESARATPGYQAGFVLDLRSPTVFNAGHLPGSVNIPLPSDPEFPESAEKYLPSVILPARHSPLLVVDDEPLRLAEVLQILAGRERSKIIGRLFPPDWPGTLRTPDIESGTGGGHLWRPDPWLQRHGGMLPPAAAGPALDLACGSGRSAVWLALRGFAATGVDHLPDALDLGRRLAVAHEVHCDFTVGDLRDLAVVPQGPWSVITIFRYLQRDLLDHCCTLLKPGGVMLVRTFLDRPGYDGKPARRHRLGCGELPGYFPASDFIILAYEESEDPDGRPAAGIVVRRKPGS